MRNYTSALLLMVLSCGYVAAQANPPLLLTQLENRTVNAWYEVVRLEVQVSGYPLFHYFWRKDGEFFSTEQALVFGPVDPTNAGIYDVIVSNVYGSVTSAPAVLTVNAQAPGINEEPQDTFGCTGSETVISAAFGGAAPLRYQWQLNGTNYRASQITYFASGDSTLIIPAYPTDAGAYTLVVSNAYGSVTSRVARLTVDPARPMIYYQPQSALYAPGSSEWISCHAFSCSPMTYQWRSNGVALAGATNYWLNLFTSLDNTAAYDVIISNLTGAVTSQVAVVLVTNLAPEITCQPRSQTVFGGESTWFSVSAYAAPLPSFQWLHNGMAIPGEHESRLYLYSIPTNAAGTYQVVVSNPVGVVTSAVATLTVIILPPEILESPQSRTVDCGQSASFSVWVGGSPPFQFQWRLNGQDIPGGEDGWLTLGSVYPTNAGDYTVVVSNGAGAVTSAVARLDVVVSAPVIQAQPQSQEVYYGYPASLSISVAGAPAPTCYWYQNGNLRFRETSSISYTNYPFLSSFCSFPYVTDADAGTYVVVLSNFVGAVTSQVATLTVSTSPPVITNQPQSQVVYEGDTVSFRVGAFAGPPPTYQWQRNGSNLTGATNSDYAVHGATVNEAGGYTVVVSNQFGAVTSAVAVLTVQLRPPSIAYGPSSQTVNAGSLAYFFVTAGGSQPLSFQWQHDGRNIPGATFPYLYLSSVSSNDAGSYCVVVTNVVGTAVSSNAILTVRYVAPTFSSQPQSQSVMADSSVTFSALAVGGPAPTYQWYFRDQPIPGAYYNNLQFVVSSTNQAGDYYVVASNFVGAATSQLARLTVQVTLPSFIREPASQGVVVGGGLGFNAWAEGHPRPVFQWQFNGQDIPGATNSHLSINPVEIAHAGNYAVAARNEAGSVTSRVAVISVSLPGPLDRWEWRQPRPQGNDLWSVAYGNGRFVALGDEGTRMTSSDGGFTWTFTSAGLAQSGRVAWGNGLFVAVSYGNDLQGTRICTVQTSTDGVHWTTLSPDTYGALPLSDLTFGGGRFVASDTSGRVIVSTNGLTWTAPVQVSNYLISRLAYLNGLFYAVLSRYDFTEDGPEGYLAVSPDGLAWTQRSLGQYGYFRDITFGHGQFVMAGYSDYAGQGMTFTSPDGLSWTRHLLPGITNSNPHIAYGAGTFVIVAEPARCALLSSQDGVNWTLRSTAPTNELYDVTFGGGRFVAVGNYGNIFVSTNGEIWTTASGGTDRNLRSVARGPSLYVAVGNEGLLFTSPDGAAWTRRPAPTTNNLRGVTFANGRFVAVGEADALSATVLASSDGIAWTRQPVNTSRGLYSVTFSEGRFVAVGDQGVIFHSPDGLTWTNCSSATTYRLNSVAKAPGMLVAVGRHGAIVTSTNGMDWSNVSPVTTEGYFQGVAYGNGRFVAAGQDGLLYTSTNGVNWSQQASPFASQYWGWTDIEDLAFANGVFIAVGARGRIATSEDGLLWTWHRSGCHNDLRGILYAGSRFMAVGNNETILQSDLFGPPILHCRAYSNEGFEFLVEGEIGRTYKLQGSTDLVTWTDLFTFTSQQGRTVFLDGEAGVYSRQFYRVVCP